MSDTKALAPIEEIRRNLTQMREQFKMALPPQVDPDRFIRVAVTAVQNSPYLLECDRHSLYGSCMRAAQSGLLPDGKESAIVKFKGHAVFMPMIEGILKQVRNSGELQSIMSQIIFKNDKFRYWVDSDGEHIEHEPNWFSDRGERVGVYALAKTKDGGIYIEVMSAKQVEAVRNVSPSKDSGPWSGPFADEMWRKTSLRRLSKRLPKSTDLEGLIHSDDEIFTPPKEPIVAASEQPTTVKPETTGPKRASKTARLVNESVAKTEPPPPPPEKPPVYNHAPGAANPPPPQEAEESPL